MATGEILEIVRYEPLPPATAQAYEARAFELISPHVADPDSLRLLHLAASDVWGDVAYDPFAGLSNYWMFTYYSPAEGHLQVWLNPRTYTIGPDPSFKPPPESPAIPKTFVDSDSALAIAEQAGGTAFREDENFRFLGVQGGYQVAINFQFPQYADRPLWDITYQTHTAQLTFLIDMETGAVLETIQAKTPTATDALETALIKTRRIIDDPSELQLFRIYVDDIFSDGTALAWHFSFLHPTRGRIDTFADEYGGSGVSIDTTYQHPATAPFVPEVFLDSDAALTLAEAIADVQAFRTKFDVRVVVMEGGYAAFLTLDQPPFNSRPVWYFQYIAASTDPQTPVLEVILDMETGEVLDVKGLNLNVAAEDEPALPTRVELYPNYPNPFNPQTTIPFALPKASHITLTVYDVLGRAVATLADDDLPAGTHTVTWNAAAFASGLYLVRLTTDNTTRVHKVVLVK